MHTQLLFYMEWGQARTDLDVLRVKRYFRGTAVEVDAYPSTVALPPGADAEQTPEAVAHAHGCRRAHSPHAHPESIGLTAP